MDIETFWFQKSDTNIVDFIDLPTLLSAHENVSWKEEIQKHLDNKFNTVPPSIGLNNPNNDAYLQCTYTESNSWSLSFIYHDNKKSYEIVLNTIPFDQADTWLEAFAASNEKDFRKKLQAAGADQPFEMTSGFSWNLIEFFKDMKLRGSLYLCLIVLLILGDFWGRIFTPDSVGGGHKALNYGFFQTDTGAALGFIIALAITLEWILSGSARRFPWEKLFKNGFKLFFIAFGFVAALLCLIILAS